ncbi:MAG TPA: Uma2 family endonuclease [Bryobacteraceae bacterium]|nr:Uma2 family endonuclease [Bryobacteraceae bacterium]
MATTRLTIEDFEKLPDEAVKHHELVDGELVDVSGNTGEHNSLRDLLISLLLPFVTQGKLGRVLSEQEYDFRGNAHGPDVSFFGPEKCELYNRKRRVQRFVPDLAIEIVSQNDSFESLLKKAQRHRSCGTAEVWLLSIEGRQAYLYSEKQNVILEEKEEFRSGLIPGFSIRLGTLFDRV